MWPVAPALADGPTGAATGSDFSIDWLEPQGINIVDLVGAFPEQYLKGTPITYTPGFGILTYESGTRSGDTVKITAHASTRYIVDGAWSATMFGCLAQPARIDQLGTVAPASTLRIYQGTRDVTREVDLFSYLPAGKSKPIFNPRESEGANVYRYWETALANPGHTADSEIILPANMGCELIMSGKNYPDLTLVFTAQSPKVMNVSVTGQESFTFHSYLGPGFAGHLQSLVDQLYGSGFPGRAEYFPIHVPSGSDYFFVDVPTIAADPLTNFSGNPTDNAGRPTSGTYRVVINAGVSVDHVVSMGLPLRGHWQDIDQADGTYLRYDENPLQLGAPEYFLAPGVPYDRCMTFGGCSGDVLARAYNTAATMRIVYFTVTRCDRYLERLPVQMVGSGYHYAPASNAMAGGLAGSTVADRVRISEGAPDVVATLQHRALLPMISYTLPPVPPDDQSNCSANGGCGWFTAEGRMVDYIPYR